ncbi:MAG TPA: TetR/AcrR family transcriptional regulator [Candidatus Binataceae bacterium]|nr:TetR/AcrR family transcriptional regulator [Candidatus Binataceae bacterium]
MKEATAPHRRAELLERVADYILDNGLAELSLRPLAAASDTSPRMLLYFFGTKERLIAEALARIRVREQLSFRRAVAMARPADRIESLLRDWKLSATPRRQKYSRLFYEVYGLALQKRQNFPGFLEKAVGDWLPPFKEALAALGVPPAPAQALATLALGAVRGLHLDLLATGERRRVEGAYRELLRLIGVTIQSRSWDNRRPSRSRDAANPVRRRRHGEGPRKTRSAE